VAGASFTNTGLIAGNIQNSGNLSIVGATVSGSFGTLTGFAANSQGTITNTSGNVFLSGNQLLNDKISIGLHTLTNGGNLSIVSIVSITGNYSQVTGTLTEALGAYLTVGGTASITGGKITLDPNGNYTAGQTTTLLQAATGVYSGLSFGGHGLTLTGSVSGNNVLGTVGNDYVGGTLASLSNTGSIGGVGTALYAAASGSVGSLSNSGTLSASRHGVITYGHFGSVNNSGAMIGGNGVAFSTYSSAGLYNAGSIGAVTNSGLIVSGGDGLINSGTIASLANAPGGTITGSFTGLKNMGVIGTVSNSGTISGVTAAIKNSGALGPISNTGVIAGNIVSSSVSDLTLTGGSGSTVGTFTGYTAGSQGTITNTSSNVNFSAGQFFLNDAINVGTHNVVNGGATIQIANTVAVTGNFVQTSGSLIFGAASATSYGDIVVSGSANLSGGTVGVAASGNYALANGQSYTIVQAHGALSASGVSVSVTGFVASVSTITAGGYNDLVLTLGTTGTTTGTTGTVTGTTGTVTGTTGTVTGTTTGTVTGTTTGTVTGTTTGTIAPRSVYAAIGSSTGGAAVGTGAAFDQIANTNTPAAQQFVNTVLTPLAALSASAKQTAVTQLSPGQLSSQMANVAVSPAAGAIAQHQDVVTAMLDGNGTGAAAGSAPLQGSLWGQFLAGNATRDQTNGAAGYGATTYGVMAGADFTVTPELTAGVAIDWVTSRANGSEMLAGSNTRLSSYQFTGYASWRPDRLDGRLVIDGQAGFGQNSFNQTRRIAFLNESANSHYDGQQYLANVVAGYTLDIKGPVSLTPFLSIREVHLDNGAYQENGAGIANLAVGSVSTDSVTQEIGLKAGSQFDTPYGKLFPSVKLGWLHDYTNGPIALTGNLAGIVFASSSARPSADGAALGVSLDLKHTDNFDLTVEYDGEFRKDFQSNTGVVKATFKF
jgi:outer membrane autotransporter protein